VVGLIGPNGSGKTTFLNIISGIYPATRGKAFVKGEEITGLKPYQIFEKGIAPSRSRQFSCSAKYELFYFFFPG